VSATGYTTSGGAYSPPVPESDVTNLVSDLASKAASSHTHAESDVTSLVSDLAGKAASSHTHAESSVTSLVSDLAGKAASSHTHAESDVTSLVSDLGAKAPLAAPSFTGGITVASGITISSGIGRLVFTTLASDTTPKNANTTLADTGLAAALELNGVYMVDGVLIYSASTTGDLKLGWTGLTSPTFHWTAGGLTSGAAAASASINLGYDAYTDTQIVGGVGVGTKLIARPSGVLTVGAAGTLKLQFAQGTSDATDTLLYAGSSLTFRRVA